MVRGAGKFMRELFLFAIWFGQSTSGLTFAASLDDENMATNLVNAFPPDVIRSLKAKHAWTASAGFIGGRFFMETY